MFKMPWQQLGTTWSHCMTGVTLVATWMHCKPTSLAMSKETSIACHPQKMPSSCIFAEPCITWLFASKHTSLSQPMLQSQTFAQDLPMVSWWQPWCWRRPNPQNWNMPNIVDARKASVPMDAHVQEPMWRVSQHASAPVTPTNVQRLILHSKAVTETELDTFPVKPGTYLIYWLVTWFTLSVTWPNVHYLTSTSSFPLQIPILIHFGPSPDQVTFFSLSK